MMADEEASVEAGSGPAQSPPAQRPPAQNPLVAVTFQRNPTRKLKYLEAEPKALGITQIGLSVFQVGSVGLFQASNLSHAESDVPFILASLLVILAGSLAIAAQNLHLPTLKACLGMQIVACIACMVNMIITVVQLAEKTIEYSCWTFHYEENSTSHVACLQLMKGLSHWYSESVIIQAALVAISITLAAYCCKVVNCCMPPPKMPVITVQAPPAHEDTT